MKSKDQQLLEEAYHQVISENDSLDFSKLSAGELLKKYKDAFDKQYTGGGPENDKRLESIISEIRKRGGKLLIQSRNYADYKRNLER